MVIAKFNYDQYNTLEEKAKWFAYYHHGVTLHMYDGKPYHEAHLAKVVEVAKRYLQWVPEGAQDEVLAACWLHDTIEDARVTYNDIVVLFGTGVADIVYALTTEKGKNRKERANTRYYVGIRSTPCATFVKLCDRIANIEHSLESKSSMLNKYRSEHLHFMQALDDNYKYANMWQHLDYLLFR